MAAMTWKGMRRMLARESLLKQIGLEHRSPGGDFLTGLGLFSVGVLVGAGLGLLFAPRRGEDMRALVTEALRSRTASKLSEAASQMGAEAGVPPATTIGH
jgi:hypothetical protein